MGTPPPYFYCKNCKTQAMFFIPLTIINMSAPPELLQFFHRILKSCVLTQRQTAGNLNVMKQCLALAISQFDLDKKNNFAV